MRTRAKGFGCPAVAIALAINITAHSAQDRTNDQNPFDRDRDGTLNADEQRAYLMHRADPFFRQYDTNHDGLISLSEGEAHRRSVLQKVSMDERSLHEERGQAGPILASELSNRFPVAKPSRTAFDRLWDIQIRRSIDDVDPFWALVSDSAYDKELKKVKPATFSYARDFASDADIWTARGVVARPFLIGKNETLALVPSVSFDRVDNGVDPKKDLDSLVFRLSGDYAAVLYAGKEDSFTAFFRARAAYKTNFGFDENKMLAGEFEWEPVPSALGFGTFKNHIPGFVRFRPRVFLHAEAGSAQSERAELSEDEKDFLRCGPAAVLEIAPDARDESWTSFNERLLLTLKYNYYWSAKADTDFENFTARLDWTLDSKGHFKAALEFQDGSLELETQSVQIFTVGLGVAF